MIDFGEIVEVQYERGVRDQFNSFVRNGWGQILIDYLKKKDAECLKETGWLFIDPETHVIQCIRNCGDKIMVRLVHSDDNEIRFAEGEELFQIHSQSNVIYINTSELLSIDEKGEDSRS